MHGLVFVTWEKYLSERFQGSVLTQYRVTINETPSTAPLASRVYDDKLLLAGVSAASNITGLSVEQLLHEFGRYFIMNGLTGHLCAYLLTQVESSRDLLLAMRAAHKQMGRLPDGLTPPLFQYEVRAHRPQELVLLYDSPRHLCPLLRGAIEGAAERYGEKVDINERTCMKRGDALCRFEMRFSKLSNTLVEPPVQRERYLTQQQFAQFIFSSLPSQEGVTLVELQTLLQAKGVDKKWTRPARLLEALQHLHHAGLAASTANQPGDTFTSRRYWRAPTSN